jgi:hypothetical protein
MATVFWAALLERSVPEHGALSLMAVASHCGKNGYRQLGLSYMRTDAARNTLIAKFREVAHDPNDVLVMLDCDHRHPMDIVERLVSHGPEIGVVGAQAHRRGSPFDMCAFVRVGQQLHTLGEWPPDSLIPVAIVGTGAIAIRRWVFDQLDAAGFPQPFFRYVYTDGGLNMPSEDIFFGLICEQAGIPHHVDTGCVTPHLIVNEIDQSSWEQWRREHAERMRYIEMDENGNVVGEKGVGAAPAERDGEPGLISIVLPTTGRRDMALDGLRGLLATTYTFPVEYVVVVDHDEDSYVAIDELLASAGVRYVMDYSDEYRGHAAAWNRGLELSHGEFIVFAADDLEWGEGWLTEAMQVMRERHDGYGLVAFNDGHHDGRKLGTHYLLSRSFIIDHLGGRLSWECYKSQYVDMEVNERAKRVGRYAWAEKARVTHQHWMFGTRGKDETDARNEAADAESKAAYLARLEAGFPDDYPPVIVRANGRVKETA